MRPYTRRVFPFDLRATRRVWAALSRHQGYTTTTKLTEALPLDRRIINQALAILEDAGYVSLYERGGVRFWRAEIKLLVVL